MKITVTMEFEGADAMEKATRFLMQPVVDGVPEVTTSNHNTALQEPAPKPKRPKKAEDKPAEAAPQAGKVFVAADAQAAIEKLFEAKGLEVSLQVLSRFGVKFIRDMKPEQYGPFIDLAEKVIAGAEV